MRHSYIRRIWGPFGLSLVHDHALRLEYSVCTLLAAILTFNSKVLGERRVSLVPSTTTSP